MNSRDERCVVCRAIAGAAVVACGLACPAWATDLNGDGVVDATDQAILLASWGKCESPCPSDLNGDGVVDGADLSIWMAWEPIPEDDTSDPDTVETAGLYTYPLSKDGSDPVDDEWSDPLDTSTGGSATDPFDGVSTHVVPLPAPIWLGAAGLGGMAIIRRKFAGATAAR